MKNVVKSREKICIVSSQAPKPVVKKLQALNYNVLCLPVLTDLNSKEGAHPDMQFCRISETELVHAPGVDPSIISYLKEKHFTIIEGNTKLKRKYPHNIAYNLLVTDTLFFHNLKYTDSLLFQKLCAGGLSPVQSKQGYAACSSFAIKTPEGKMLILTGDRGMEKNCMNQGLEVIFCEGTENIRLRGYDHGFVGGCCGKDGNQLLTCGSIEKTFYNGKEILEQLRREGITVTNLWGGRMRDIGGILIL